VRIIIFTLYTHVMYVYMLLMMWIFEEHFSVTIFRSTINNACGSDVRDSCSLCVVSMKTYLCYIKALSQLALILLQHWVSIVLVQLVAIMHRLEMQSENRCGVNASLKCYFGRKSRIFYLIMRMGSVPSIQRVLYTYVLTYAHWENYIILRDLHLRVVK